MTPLLEHRAPSPLPPLGHDISRPSSTSTSSSRNLAAHYGHPQRNMSLPGLPALSSTVVTPLSQMRTFSGINHNATYPNASPTPTSVGGHGNTPPRCQNCQTSTTPLWRRDEQGSVLCNACGLFLKLHNRPRPISLKTDVIKSRNRVKTAGQGPRKKPTLEHPNGASRPDLVHPQHGSVTHPHPYNAPRRSNSDHSDSPISRSATPLHPAHVFGDSHNLPPDFTTSHSPGLPPLSHLRHPSPGSMLSVNDRHLEIPQTYEALKTRVAELEVINNLIRDQLDATDKAKANEARRWTEELTLSARREDVLKRRIDDLEQELLHVKSDGGRSPKRQRLEMSSTTVSPKTISEDQAATT